MRLILASNNAKKLAEMRALLAGLGVEIASLFAASIKPQVLMTTASAPSGSLTSS